MRVAVTKAGRNTVMVTAREFERTAVVSTKERRMSKGQDRKRKRLDALRLNHNPNVCTQQLQFE
jgi:hypothetical protein